MSANTQHIAILGGGESGLGAALLARAKGYDVYLSDSKDIRQTYKSELLVAGIPFDENKHDLNRILNCDLVVKSPGIPDEVATIKKCHSANIPVISEIEFAWKHCEGTIIGITGSNGKTTTTSLIGFMLDKAGLDVAVAGNIGKSFARQLAEGDRDYWVLELSSFQLDGTVTFRPHIAIILNITPDHLDRYDNKFENYAASKLKITQNLENQDFLIYWKDDPTIRSLLSKLKANPQLVPFGEGKYSKTKQKIGGTFDGKQIHIQTLNNYLIMSIHDLALQGKHNIFNSMASGLTGRILELRKEVVRDSLSNFENMEHRLEKVAKVASITFINDSKATNVNSTWYALESVENGVIWIAGGVDKGNDYSDLFEMVEEKVKAIICLGPDNKKIHKAFEGKVPQIVDVMSADEAVRVAYDLGYKGDTVLLSPACASFDLFENYEDRGHQFKAAVKRL